MAGLDDVTTGYGWAWDQFVDQRAGDDTKVAPEDFLTRKVGAQDSARARAENVGRRWAARDFLTIEREAPTGR
jgi:hypothetical protein